MAPPQIALSHHQPAFPQLCPVTDAVASMSSAGIEERGAIYTRREVVEFMLDLVGYTPDRALCSLRLLEPSFGEGDFLIPVVERLLKSWREAGRPDPFKTLGRAISGVELHRETAQKTTQKVTDLLRDGGVEGAAAREIAQTWLIQGDFLLVELEGSFDVVVGNPPYVRQEMIPDALMAEYRARYRTIFDRADLYIPFFERSLKLLSKGGLCSFICADRWMKNRYGGPLREYVSKDYHLQTYVDMVDTPAFHSDVIAYPAITVIGRENLNRTLIARRPAIEACTLSDLAAQLTGKTTMRANGPVQEIQLKTSGDAPWILDESDELTLVRRLESSFPLIEEAGCKVGIGVATGADKAFIGKFDEMDVEADRKLPLVMTRDIDSGHVQWRGYGVINPFSDEGKLVDLLQYPKLKRYLDERREAIAGRHIAKKAPASWYRTIDRIYPALAKQPKLLIPDIKGGAHIVYEEGEFYPHHNLYFITSNDWDIRALQAVLLSGIARLFVATYSTKMRGGYLRFQAQYLRKIRLPQWKMVQPDLRAALIEAAGRRDVDACNELVFQLYGLSRNERAALIG